jgi:hypothetical protein
MIEGFRLLAPILLGEYDEAYPVDRVNNRFGDCLLEISRNSGNLLSQSAYTLTLPTSHLAELSMQIGTVPGPRLKKDSVRPNFRINCASATTKFKNAADQIESRAHRDAAL